MYLHGLKRRLSSERGSISILTIGLFSIVLVTALILTDISSIYLAKRSLTLATEAAAQRGVKNLDQEAYYQGEFNSIQMGLTIAGFGEEDPGIPIDCDAGGRDASEVLAGWSDYTVGVGERIELISFECDGFQILLRTSQRVQLPIPIPFIDIREVRIESTVSSIGERAKSNNYSGIDIG